MTSKENCKGSVLKYLTSQNRPYSANDVLQNLHKEFGKTAVQKALDDLTFECKIREKIYGKQKVYAAVQENEFAGNETELVELDSKIDQVSDKLKTAEQELKKREFELKDLESQPTTEAAIEEKNDLEDAIIKLNDKVEMLSKSSVEITEEDKNKVYADHEKVSKEHRKRKNICMEIINSILENYPKKMRVLLDEIGIETDDDFRGK